MTRDKIPQLLGKQIENYIQNISNGSIAVLVENSDELEKVRNILQKETTTIFVYDPNSSEYKDSDDLGKYK